MVHFLTKAERIMRFKDLLIADECPATDKRGHAIAALVIRHIVERTAMAVFVSN
jgi:hypothetical protein